MTNKNPKTATLDDIVDEAIEITQNYDAQETKQQQLLEDEKKREAQRHEKITTTMPQVWAVATSILERIKAKYDDGKIQADVIRTKANGNETIILDNTHPQRTGQFGVALRIDYHGDNGKLTAEIGLWQAIAFNSPTGTVSPVVLLDISKPKSITKLREFSIVPVEGIEERIESAIAEAFKITIRGLSR